MSEVLIDTDVVSALFKATRKAETYRRFIRNQSLAVCFASVAELYHWTLTRRWGMRKIEQLHSLLRSCAILSYDDDMAWAWARVQVACEAVGRPMAPTDAWIAAAAIRFDLPLLTGNLKHFEAARDHAGLRLSSET
ncbi:MAG: PIN domain-containing protein [Phycisphaerales bacterium]|nr:PIN domain-containing protein [Phycisphaerales bacterium]MCI0676896.1 PIN domain-containing protein [Phycisphaerales bacterium]